MAQWRVAKQIRSRFRWKMKLIILIGSTFPFVDALKVANNAKDKWRGAARTVKSKKKTEGNQLNERPE